jgi:hypothetical protein
VQQEDRRATGTCTSDSRDARAAGGTWIQLYDDALVLSQQRRFYAYSAIANATASAWNDLWLLTVLAVTSMRRRGGRSLGDSTQQPRRVATVPSYPPQNHQINRECATLSQSSTCRMVYTRTSDSGSRTNRTEFPMRHAAVSAIATEDIE